LKAVRTVWDKEQAKRCLAGSLVPSLKSGTTMGSS